MPEPELRTQFLLPQCSQDVPEAGLKRDGPSVTEKTNVPSHLVLL